MENSGLDVTSRSRLYRTPAFPADSGPDFVNAVVSFRSDQPPDEIVAALHGIEADFGRRRRKRWAARVLDLDLLAFGDHVLPDPETYAEWREMPLDEQLQRAPEELILPHPRIQDRAFVLVPLAEIAPDWKHPVSGQTAREMRDALAPEDIAAVTPL